MEIKGAVALAGIWGEEPPEVQKNLNLETILKHFPAISERFEAAIIMLLLTMTYTSCFNISLLFDNGESHKIIYIYRIFSPIMRTCV